MIDLDNNCLNYNKLFRNTSSKGYIIFDLNI